jgi:hypothetical protein
MTASTDALLLAAVDRLLWADDLNRYPLDGHVESAIRSLREIRRSVASAPSIAGPVPVYVAAPLSEVLTARVIADALRADGFAVASTWHATVEPGDVDEEGHSRRDALMSCLQDLARARMVVAWTATGTPRAAFGEIGVALACDKPVVWIQGNPARREGRCIFDADPRVTVLSSLRTEDMLLAVRQVVAGMRWGVG